MKKQLLLFVMMLLPMVAHADESGTCGTNLTWTYYETTHSLVIVGSGEMNDYFGANAPWYKYCSDIVSVTLPEGLTTICDNAFYFCSGLTSVTIPNSVTSIGDEAFAGCSGLTSLTIPNSVTSIGIWAFSGCTGLTSIIVESGNTVYDSRDNCNAIIETSTNKLLSGCSKTTIPNSVTSIGSRAFFGCTGLTSVIIPNCVTSIGSGAFSGCTGLTGTLIIPNSVTFIGEYGFDYCTSLTSFSIGSGLKKAEFNTFADCTGLTYIEIFNPTPPKCIDKTFSGIDFTIPLYVPNGTYMKYKAAEGWRQFVIIREMGGDSDVYLSINDGSHGNVNIKVDENNPYVTLKFEPDNGWHLYSVKLNDENVTEEVGLDGIYTTPAININSNLTVVYAQGVASAPSINANHIDLSTNGNELVVSGTTGGECIAVYTMNGVCVSKTMAKGRQTTIPLATRQNYIVKVGDLILKYCY